MSLSRKFVIMLIASITSIAILNIGAFYIFYNSYIRLYLSEKIESRKEVTIDYINNIIERQAIEDIDDIFSNAELEFFDLLDINDGKIPLQEEENVNVVVNFLVKSGVSSKYIEEIIPENNLEKILISLQDSNSPESHFITRLFKSLVIINLIILVCFAAGILFFTKKIILPIKKATNQIKKMKLGKTNVKINYSKKDEIGLLIQSINGLNVRLSIQEKIRSRLLADISHELKTPITSIQCYLEGISDGVIDLSEKNLDSITKEMSRLIELVNKIMEYEKFENTEISIKKISQNPYKLISELIETQKIYLQENKQTINITGSKNIELFLDPDLFTQLIYNLIGNFIKYSGEATQMEINISSTQISFKDNGIGIPKKEIPFLFEKFYQGKKEKTGNISLRGIGVGLSIVKKVIDVHDWDGKIESDNKKGFHFTITF